MCNWNRYLPGDVVRLAGVPVGASMGVEHGGYEDVSLSHVCNRDGEGSREEKANKGEEGEKKGLWGSVHDHDGILVVSVCSSRVGIARSSKVVYRREKPVLDGEQGEEEER
jgi:hypothetical protein